MQTLFDRVQANKRRTWFIFLLFYVMFIVLGLVVGAIWGNLTFGVILSLVVALLYMLIVLASAENMILATSKAQPVTRESQPMLYNVVDSMHIAAGVPMPKIYVIDDSAMNAFATGRDPQHGILVVTSGLLKNMNRRELEGVVAHEMSHIKNYDIRVMLFAAVLVGAITLLADVILRSFLWGGKRGDREGGSAMLILIVVGLVLAILAPFIAQLVQLAVSRRREYLADADAAVLTRYPKGLSDALKKIAKDPDPLVDTANKATAHLYISMPFRRNKFGEHSWWVRMWSTPPPIEERIKILDSM